MEIRASQEEEWPPNVPDGVVLGRKVGGEEALPVRGSAVIWPFKQLDSHAVIFGDPDSGRTETALRMAHDFALKTGAPVFCLDARGDAELAERFKAVMGRVERRVHVFPDEPFDAWRGDPRVVASRLCALAGLEREENGVDTHEESEFASLLLSIAWGDAGNPPHSSNELLARLNYESLLASGRSAVRIMQRDVIERICQRFRSLFEKLDGALDGSRAWDDLDAGYIGLGSSRSSGAPNLARFFLHDWIYYLGHRKPPGQPSLMLINGMTEDLMSGQDLQQEILNQAGMRDTGVVLSWDSPADIGPERQGKIIVGALWTVMVHRTSRPEKIANLAGQKRASKMNFAALPDGTAWIIQGGSATKVAIDPV